MNTSPPTLPKPTGNGFSLVEMAVLLVIMGLIVAALLPRIISGTTRDLMAEHKRVVRSARHEVLGYAKAHGCTLPPPAWFAAIAPHRLGRKGAGIVYTPNATVILPNGTSQVVAFLLASNGTNGQVDPGAVSGGPDYASAGITVHLGNLTDDAVDFATQAYVNSLCTP